jgi:hypothetical protein
VIKQYGARMAKLQHVINDIERRCVEIRQEFKSLSVSDCEEEPKGMLTLIFVNVRDNRWREDKMRCILNSC